MIAPGRDHPPRVVVHGGFHKTGTTSAQQFLWSNGEFMFPRAALVLPGKLRHGAARMAVRYSRTGKAGHLSDYKDALAMVLGGLDLGLKRHAVISDENLCGRMPGRDGHEGYDAAPALMAATAEVIRDAIHPDADIHFLFTTRDADIWLRSCWLHNLRNSRLELDFDAYRAFHEETANLADTVEAIRQTVSPHPVHSVALEDLSGNPEGPAAAILQLLDHPRHLRDQMRPAQRLNTAPQPELADQLLEMNRSDLHDAALTQRKAALLGRAIDTDDRNA